MGEMDMWDGAVWGNGGGDGKSIVEEWYLGVSDEG